MRHPDRYFTPSRLTATRELYATIQDLPLICPHGHVDPRLFADPNYQFSNPTELLLIPDHYILRMLYSQGITLENLGLVPRGQAPYLGEVRETHLRAAWQIFADHFYLFRGTPTGLWLTDEFENVFGVTEKLNSANAQAIYDQIAAKLCTPDFQPRYLFKQFNIEVLCTTDAATSKLAYHQQIHESGWKGQIRPTFRPDTVIHLTAPGWRENIHMLEQVTNSQITSYPAFLAALENRRAFFKSQGATATDLATQTALTLELTPREAETIFQHALRGQATPEETDRFTAHLVIEMARMSAEDGLVMQLHIGSYRNHNSTLFQTFGPDIGADIPITSEFTRNLKPLLDRFGAAPRLTLILFTLDETNYARELAPLAGHYPALKLGPPWWFHDSLNGMRRYFEQIMETTGLYNTVGFNDDTRAFPSIPARHDLWRRIACDWVAGLMVRHIIDENDAHEMVRALAYDLAKVAYKL
ncbi:MAG: glucuronate isomerase [Anaerolineales bacterium]|nr:glucuronate isomerase [Anaerolineales bacterium]